MDGGAWWAAVHGVARSQAQLSDFTFTFHFHALEKEMATHSSVLAWRIPGTGEPGGLPSMESHRVGHDWSDLAVAEINSYLGRNLDRLHLHAISLIGIGIIFILITGKLTIVLNFSIHPSHAILFKNFYFVFSNNTV